jgi:hypothetical protein
LKLASAAISFRIEIANAATNFRIETANATINFGIEVANAAINFRIEVASAASSGWFPLSAQVTVREAKCGLHQSYGNVSRETGC